ncbi:MAG TPA: branched-chain amino acid ABC transporter permease [Caldilineae bacterium]|nr:branched-chain amino acid ABC transporter permease [Caldilineae bacterium]
MFNQATLITILLDVSIWFVLYLIVTVSLNLQYGYTGIPNFGVAFAVAGGAYVTGTLAGRIARLYYNVGTDLDFVADSARIMNMVNDRLATDPLAGIALFLIIVVIALLINAFLGFLVSYPSIRVREIYLMMVLIAVAEGIRIVGTNYYPLVGGTTWVQVPNVFAWMGSAQTVAVPLLFMGIALSVYLFVHLIVQAPFGRLIRAVRENEIVVESLGKDVVKIKALVFALGSAIASLSGVLYAFYSHAVMATAFQRSDWTFWPWLMLMLGGKGNNKGALVGSFVFVIIRRIIMIFKYEIREVIPVEPIWIELLLMSSFLILIMIYRPEGLIPEEPIRVRGLRYKDVIESKMASEWREYAVAGGGAGGDGGH